MNDNNYVALMDLKKEMSKKTLSTLSKLSGLHINTISRWEHGSMPNAKFCDLANLANELGFEFLLFPKE